MSDDEFDELVDDAAHAVNNLIPAEFLIGLGADARSDLFYRINDALTPIMRDVVGDAQD